LINRKDRKDRKAGNLRESGFSPGKVIRSIFPSDCFFSVFSAFSAVELLFLGLSIPSRRKNLQDVFRRRKGLSAASRNPKSFNHGWTRIDTDSE
jgi:hypothetical protein